VRAEVFLLSRDLGPVQADGWSDERRQCRNCFEGEEVTERAVPVSGPQNGQASAAKIQALRDDEALQGCHLCRRGIFGAVGEPADLGHTAHEQKYRQHGQIFCRDRPDLSISIHAGGVKGTKTGEFLALIQGRGEVVHVPAPGGVVEINRC